jgi:hypothetical protein
MQHIVVSYKKETQRPPPPQELSTKTFPCSRNKPGIITCDHLLGLPDYTPAFWLCITLPTRLVLLGRGCICALCADLRTSEVEPYGYGNKDGGDAAKKCSSVLNAHAVEHLLREEREHGSTDTT